MKKILSPGAQLLQICVITLFMSGCVTRTATHRSPDSRLSRPSVPSSSLSEHIRAIYKVESEASRHEEQRAALLSSAPELADLLDQAEKDPRATEARSRIVNEYMSRELYWGAYELLSNTLSENIDPDASINLAIIWDAWGQYSLALQYGERGIANGAASETAYRTLGRIHLHRSDPTQAIVWYSRSLEFGQNAPTLANIGYAYMLLSEWEKAKVNLEEAVALDDTLEQAHNNLAVVLSRTGDDTRALAQLLHSGRPAVAFNNMGVLYMQAKNVLDAQHYFEEALRLEPDYETARHNLDSLQEFLPPPSILHLPSLRSGLTALDQNPPEVATKLNQ